MIKEYLDNLFSHRRLYNSWLINTPDVASTLQNLEDFIKSTLLATNLDLNNHPDYKKIERAQAHSGILAKNIVVDQITILKSFLGKTSGISENKVAVIVNSEAMNIHSANACLKILEEPPKKSYIFLLTSRPGSIIATIRSRCAKLNLAPNVDKSTSYEQSINLLINKGVSFDLELEFLQKLSEKNRQAFEDFSNDALNFLAKIIKHYSSIRQEFNASELEVINQLPDLSPASLLKIYDNLVDFKNNVGAYDLELKSAAILLINQFKNFRLP